MLSTIYKSVDPLMKNRDFSRKLNIVFVTVTADIDHNNMKRYVSSASHSNQAVPNFHCRLAPVDWMKSCFTSVHTPKCIA